MKPNQWVNLTAYGRAFCAELFIFVSKSAPANGRLSKR